MRWTHSLLRHELERASVAIQYGLLACKFLPAPDNTINVSRIDFQETRLAATPLARDQGRARTAEQVHDEATGLAAIDERAVD